MNFIFYFLILFAALTPTTLPAVTQILSTQEEKAPTPDPVSLDLLWWQHFEVETSQLPTRIEGFLANLKTIASKTSLENQEEVFLLVGKIEASLKAFMQAKNHNPSAQSSPQAHADHYSIDKALELSRQIRTKNTLLKTDQDNLIDKQRQIEIAQQHLEKQTQNYRKLDGRNETKLISGLKLVSFQIPLELAKVRIQILQNTIVQIEEEIKRLKQELAVASSTLKSNDAEKARLLQENKAAEISWAAAAAERTEKEISNAGAFTFGQMTDKAKMEAQNRQQELIQASIRESIAYNHFLFKQIQINLVTLLTASQEVNLSELGQSIKNWQNWTDQLVQRSKDWERHIQRELQRPDGVASLVTGDGISETKAITQLKQQLSKLIQSNLTSVQHLTTEIEDNKALLDLLSKQYVSTKGYFAKGLSDTIDFLYDTVISSFDMMNKVLFFVGTTPVTLMSFLRCILIMIASFWFSRFVLKALTDIAKARNDIKKSVIYRINRLVHYLILMLGAILALSSIGFDLSSLALIAGALGVGLGFGLQSIFNNFISGIIILFESQLKVGDLVELESGLRGEVKEINVRSTHIKTSDGIAVIVPNSEFIDGKVINWTLEDPYRRVHIPFSVAYDSNKDLIAKVVEEAAMQVSLTLPTEQFPPPKVFLKQLGDHGLDYELAVWIDDTITKGNLMPFSLYSYAIHDALIKNGIETSTPHSVITISRLLDKTRWDENAPWLGAKQTAHPHKEMKAHVNPEAYQAN